MTEHVHGGPYDRGSADSYYGRGRDPHYYPLGTYNGDRVEAYDMTAKQIAEYNKDADEGSEINYFSETSYMGIDLKSPGHKKICEKLEQMGVMFFFESPCKLLGDSKSLLFSALKVSFKMITIFNKNICLIFFYLFYF